MSGDLYSGFATDSGSFVNTATMPIAQPRMSTASLMADSARPMTSNRAVGYSSKRGNSLDQFISNSELGPAAPLQQMNESGPTQKAKTMETEINEILQSSIQQCGKDDLCNALDNAKKARKKERELVKFLDRNGLKDSVNFDLTIAVLFNLAYCFELSGLFQESLNTYSLIVRDKQYPQSSRFRVNMGNIYYRQNKYPQSIKMYRMAMDEMGTTNQCIKLRIMRNIGNAFIQTGQFGDAIQSYETVMETMPDPVTGFNLIVAYYAMGDKEKMRKAFTQLSCIAIPNDRNEDDNSAPKDSLSIHLQTKWLELARSIQMAAQLIAVAIADTDDPYSGYDWIVNHLKNCKLSLMQPDSSASQTGNEDGVGSSQYARLLEKVALEITVAKGIAYLKHKSVDKAISVFKQLETQSDGILDKAATNLSFVYFLESDLNNATKYAEKAVSIDRYNANALVNRANCLFAMGQLDQAKELCLEAIGVEADCTEAIFNLGLVCKALQHYDDALQAFRKLHRICPKDVQTMFHIAHLYELQNDITSAVEWYKIVHGSVRNDGGILSRLATLYRSEEDETQAFHNYLDAYRCLPVNLDIISWLGVWYVNSELYEQALGYFMRAAQIQPNELKWKLMVASCYRRMRNYPRAIQIYKSILTTDPDNVKCLEYLCILMREINDPQLDEFEAKLDELKSTLARQMGSAVLGADINDDINANPNQPQSSARGSVSHSAMPSARDSSSAATEDNWDDDDDDLADDLLPM